MKTTRTIHDYLALVCYCNEYKDRFCIFHRIYAFSYQSLMKVMHKYDWHYAPVIHGTGFKQRWCQWCGFRETFETWEVVSHVNDPAQTERTQ